jgi:hypothetical protein
MKHLDMKTIKLIATFIVMLAGLSSSAAPPQVRKSIKPPSPRALVVSLYNQHKKRSPFFQTRSRALLDKYFDKQLAGLLWQDARSSGGEVGALDGDPLFNAQDMEITNFSVQEGTVGRQAAEVLVSFKNLGQKHQITFQLVSTATGWKIADISYDDGTSLLKILRGDGGAAEGTQAIKIYLVALGDDGQTGKKIGCGDSLVPVTRTIKKTVAPLTAALRELLLTPQRSDETPGLENFWKGRGLNVKSVSLRNSTATIHLSGEVFVAGVCDLPRIESQIEATAQQFPNVKRVKVFIGKRTLADAIR